MSPLLLYVGYHSLFWLENLKGRNHLEDLDVDGKIIFMHLREVGWEDVDWMHLVQDRSQWRYLVSTVINLRVA
jgi:hypothetical protein